MSFVKNKHTEDEMTTKLSPVSPPTGNLEAFLGKGSKVNGKLVFEGPVNIDGEVEGEIEAKSKLLIGESAKVKATIKGSEIIVKGSVEGDIFASSRLILQKPAKVQGNIAGPAVSIEEGVVFEGNCKMTKSSDSSKSVA